MTKDELLAHLEQENAQFEALLAEIGPARMEDPGVAGNWSAKDVVAHLTGWRRRTVARLEAALRGDDNLPPLWPAHLQTDDDINAWMHERDKNLSVDEVLAQSRQVFDGMVAALAAMPEDALQEAGRFPWMDGHALSDANFFGHFHDEHEADLRAWATSRRAGPR